MLKPVLLGPVAIHYFLGRKHNSGKLHLNNENWFHVDEIKLFISALRPRHARYCGAGCPARAGCRADASTGLDEISYTSASQQTGNVRTASRGNHSAVRSEGR
jgi:hypothetical protein